MQYERSTRRPSGNSDAHDGTRDDVMGVSGCAAPQKCWCPNRLFLGTNRETSCRENTCHHRCFFSWGDGHTERGRYTCNSTGSRILGHATRHFIRVYVFLDLPLEWREIDLPLISNEVIDSWLETRGSEL